MTIVRASFPGTEQPSQQQPACDKDLSRGTNLTSSRFKTPPSKRFQSSRAGGRNRHAISAASRSSGRFTVLTGLLVTASERVSCLVLNYLDQAFQAKGRDVASSNILLVSRITGDLREKTMDS
nr:hypothetical protein Iba_chr07eCG6500 [Ipomoea batatas]